MRLLLALLLASPAVATAQTAPPQEDIVIRATREADCKAAQTYVANISVRSDGQLARFHQPVCPNVIGLNPRYAAIVEKRIVADAVAAGAPVAKKPRCSPNLFVMIASNGSDLVKDMRVNRPGWLAGLSTADIDALIAPSPARAWSITSLRNEDGEALEGPGALGGAAFGDVPVLRVRSASIVNQPNRPDVEASFVVIDQASTIGLTLRQIADNAAMRGLARTRPPKPGGAIYTILTAPDPDAARPRELTTSDAAYLRALYASEGTSTAVTERNAIARRIAKGK